MAQDQYHITDEAGLVETIGDPMEFVRAKVMSDLNQAMRDFIGISPLIFVSTIDEQGNVDISPKGDPAGFVQVTAEGDLLVPERPGNRLCFGFRNILRNGRVGIIFVAPHQRETVRVKGTATLHNDPDLLADMDVKGKPALLYMRVKVEECFFHCGKAMIRSHMWQPDKWPEKERAIAARGLFPDAPKQDESVRATEASLDKSYREDLY